MAFLDTCPESHICRINALTWLTIDGWERDVIGFFCSGPKAPNGREPPRVCEHGVAVAVGHDLESLSDASTFLVDDQQVIELRVGQNPEDFVHRHGYMPAVRIEILSGAKEEDVRRLLTTMVSNLDALLVQAERAVEEYFADAP